MLRNSLLIMLGGQRVKGHLQLGSQSQQFPFGGDGQLSLELFTVAVLSVVQAISDAVKETHSGLIHDFLLLVEGLLALLDDREMQTEAAQ